MIKMKFSCLMHILSSLTFCGIFLNVVGVSYMVLLVICAVILVFFGSNFFHLPKMCSSKLIPGTHWSRCVPKLAWNDFGITHFGLKQAQSVLS